MVISSRGPAAGPSLFGIAICLLPLKGAVYVLAMYDRKHCSDLVLTDAARLLPWNIPLQYWQCWWHCCSTLRCGRIAAGGNISRELPCLQSYLQAKHHLLRELLLMMQECGLPMMRALMK
jgi:hypothetical protein